VTQRAKLQRLGQSSTGPGNKTIFAPLGSLSPKPLSNTNANCKWGTLINIAEFHRYMAPVNLFPAGDTWDLSREIDLPAGVN